MITDILDTAERLSKIQNATLNNTDGAKRIQDIVSALDGLDETAINATVSLTNLSDADKQLIADKMGATIATTADKVATDADTASKIENLKWTNLLKVAWSKFTAFAMANPWLLATAAIVGATAAIYKWSKADEEAVEASKERLSDISSEYKNVTSEIDSLNGQIKSLDEEIDNLDPITDETQIQALKDERAILEQEVALLKQRQEYLAKEEGKAAEEALQEKSSSKYSYNDYNETSSHYTGDMATDAGITIGHIIANKGISDQVTEYEELELAMQKVNDLEEQRNELKKQQSLLISEDQNYDKDYNELKTQIKNLDAQIAETEQDATNLASSVQGSWSKLSAGELKDSIGSILVEYFELTDAIDAAASSFEALSDAQQKDILTNKLQEQGLSSRQANKVLANISPEDYEKLYKVDWSNVNKPNPKDYKNYQDYGKAFAQAWLDGLNNTIKEGQSLSEPILLSFTDQLSQVQALSKGLDQLDEIMSDVMDGGDFDYSSILNNDDFKETFGKYTEEYENFIQTIANSPDDISKCQSAFDELATAYVYGSGALADLTEESKNAAILDFSQMGIENASEVVGSFVDKYNKALEIASQYSETLDNKTVQLLNDFVVEKQIVGESAEAIFDYALQKQLCSENAINTVEDCQALLNLAKQANATSEVLQLLIRLKNSMNVINSDSWGEATKKIAREEVDSIMAELRTINLDAKIDFGGGSKTKEQAKKSAKDTKDAWLEAFEKELKELQSLRDRGVIDESTYLERLRALYVHYFADREKYIDEFRKYEQEYLEGVEDLYNNAISAVVKFKDEEINALNKSKDAALDALEAEKEAREDVIDAQKEQLEYQVDLIDEQIESRNEVIDGINGEIDLIKDEIDAMQEANDERKHQLDLQKAQYELEKMTSQRTQLIYRDGQMIYQNDSSGIRDAREKVSDAELEIAIADKEKEISQKEKEISLIEKEIELFEKQKDVINKQIEALDKQSESNEKYYDNLIKQQEDYYNSLIENMEKEKSKWEELAEIKEVPDAYSAIEQVFRNLGYTVDDVLNNSAGAFETFKNQYINLLDVMNSNDSFGNGLSYAVDELDKSLANVGTNTEGLDNLPAKMEEINASVGVVSDAFSGEKDSLQSSVQNVIDKVAGSSEGNDKKDSSKDEEADTSSLIGAIQAQFDKTLEVIPQQIEAFTAYRDIVKSCVDEVYNLITATEKLATINISGIGGIPINGYATGTTHAKKGLSIVAEEAPELIKDTNDNLSLVTKPTLVNMEGGEKVYNGDTTEGLLKATENEDGTITLSDGSILKPLELGYDVDKIVANMRANLGGINAPINPIDKNIDTIVKTASNISNNHNNTQDINVSIGDIKLEGVQDVNGLAHAINTKLPNMMLQTLMKRK